MNIPKNESRKIKNGILSNGLKYAVIDDKLDDKTYISVGVGVGTNMDPDDLPGLAHFTEHMLFLGSKKFPDENYYQDKVQLHGGSSNAYTDSKITVYYLSVFHDALDEMLDIFSRFFIDPLFDKDSVSREVNAVNSEHQKNIQNDMWRTDRLYNMFYNNKNPNSKFGTGNLETLNKPGLRNRMKEFYSKYYFSSNMSIVISTNLDNDLTIKKIEKYFGVLPKKENKIINEFKLNLKRTPILKKNILNNWYHLIPVKDVNVIIYNWVIPSTIKYYKKKYWTAIGNLLSRTDKGSLYNYLYEKGYITNISVGEYEDDLYYSIFSINIYCTELGFKNISLINETLKYLLNNIPDNLDEYLEDSNKLSIQKYNYGSKISSLDLVLELVNNLFLYPLEDIYSANYILGKLNTKKLKKMIEKYLNFNNKYVFVISKKKLQENEFEIEKFYGLKYYKIKKNKLLTSPNVNFKYEPNLENKYIADKVIHYDDKIFPPKKIKTNYDFWVGKENRFKEPIVYCIISLYCPDIFNTPKKYIMITILISLYGEYFNKKYYSAFEAGNGVSISETSSRCTISIRLEGFNTKFNSFVKDFMSDFSNIPIFSKDKFNTEIENKKKSLKNMRKMSPLGLSEYILLSNSFQFVYSINELNSAINNLNYLDCIEFQKIFLKKFDPTIFYYGNYDKPISIKITDSKIKKYLPIRRKEIKCDLIIDHPNLEEKNNGISCYYLIGKFNPKLIVILDLFMKIVEVSFYDTLRTKNQLGYLVKMGSKIIKKDYFIVQKIQSQFKIKEVLDKILKFNSMINKILKNLNESSLNNWKETLKKNYLEKETKTSEALLLLGMEIFNKDYMFNRYKIMARLVDNISLQDLNDFYINYLLKNKNSFKILINGN